MPGFPGLTATSVPAESGDVDASLIDDSFRVIGPALRNYGVAVRSGPFSATPAASPETLGWIYIITDQTPRVALLDVGTGYVNLSRNGRFYYADSGDGDRTHTLGQPANEFPIGSFAPGGARAYEVDATVPVNVAAGTYAEVLLRENGVEVDRKPLLPGVATVPLMFGRDVGNPGTKNFTVLFRVTAGSGAMTVFNSNGYTSRGRGREV